MWTKTSSYKQEPLLNSGAAPPPPNVFQSVVLARFIQIRWRIGEGMCSAKATEISS
jgi:hypothetical protein